MSINRVAISGNLTRDPEVRSTQSGMSILNFGMAVNDRRRNQQTGEWEDYANFVDCVLFGNRADWLSRDLHKGKKVYVEGKLRYSSWEREGQRRSKLEVVVDEIDYERPPRQQGGYEQQQPQRSYGGQGNGGQGYGQQAPSYSAPAPSVPQQPQQPQGYVAAPQQAPQPQPQGYEPAPQQPAQQQASSPRPVVSAPPTSDVYDEDIPF